MTRMHDDRPPLALRMPDSVASPRAESDPVVWRFYLQGAEAQGAEAQAGDARGGALLPAAWLVGRSPATPDSSEPAPPVVADTDALLDLYQRAARRLRADALEHHQKRSRTLRTALEDILLAARLDASDALGASLGGFAEQMVDVEALAEALPGGGVRAFEPQDLERIALTLSTLDELSAEAALDPDVFVVCSASLGGESDDATAATATELHADPYHRAIERYDELEARYLELFRAMRRARLYAERTWSESRHASALAHLGADELDALELALLPRVLVVERSPPLEELARLLWSDRPIHVLGLTPLELGEPPRCGAGAVMREARLGYLCASHGETFVLQTTLAETEVLATGLERMAGLGRPAVALVVMPRADEPRERFVLRARAALDTRTWPTFVYDPDRGQGWAGRLDVSDNPALDAHFEATTLRSEGEGPRHAALIEPLTYGHLAALEPTLRHHFRVLAVEEWAQDQAPLGAYLAEVRDRVPDRLPYIWVAGADGTLQRAVLSRALAITGIEPLRLWSELQELAGIDNAHVRRAREQAEAEADARIAELRSSLEAHHRDELERVRLEEEEATVARLVAGLLGELRSPSAAGAAGIATETVAQAEQAPTPEPSSSAPSTLESSALAPASELPTPPPAEPDDVESELAWVDTLRCTTCDECTQINPRLFRYDENRQAYIDDPEAGSFAELVRAAEKCPAHCIYPSTPREGDDTATPEWLERAEQVAAARLAAANEPDAP